jgi:hypothetical protein
MRHYLAYRLGAVRYVAGFDTAEARDTAAAKLLEGGGTLVTYARPQ